MTEDTSKNRPCIECEYCKRVTPDRYVCIAQFPSLPFGYGLHEMESPMKDECNLRRDWREAKNQATQEEEKNKDLGLGYQILLQIVKANNLLPENFFAPEKGAGR